MGKKARRELFGPEQVATMFGFTSRTLERYIKRGWFPRPRNIGGRRRWTQEDLDAYRLHADRWYPEGDEISEEEDDEEEEKRPPQKKSSVS